MSSNIIATDLQAKIERPVLAPCHISLGKVYIETNAEKLVSYPVTALEIPGTEETPLIQLNEILEKQTNCSLMLESFYNDNIAIRAAGSSYYLNSSLGSQNISHCIVQNAQEKLG